MRRIKLSTNEAVILFSGGTDSTLTAALLQDKFDLIHLITYDRFGIFEVENSKENAKKLQEKYGKEKFIHRIINFDEVFKRISYEKYFKNLMKFGFMNLSTCGLCKLSMHVLTVVYCLENKVSYVADGANKGMEIFPAQMDTVLEQLRHMYGEFDIEYTNPVFDFDAPPEKTLIKDENMALLQSQMTKPTDNRSEKNQKETTGELLHKLGLSPEKDIKGTRYDQRRQPRCFQFMLFSVFVNKWFLPGKDMQKYRKETFEFFKEKIQDSTLLLKEYQQGKHKKVFALRDQ